MCRTWINLKTIRINQIISTSREIIFKCVIKGGRKKKEELHTLIPGFYGDNKQLKSVSHFKKKKTNSCRCALTCIHSKKRVSGQRTMTLRTYGRTNQTNRISQSWRLEVNGYAKFLKVLVFSFGPDSVRYVNVTQLCDIARARSRKQLVINSAISHIDISLVSLSSSRSKNNCTSKHCCIE